LLLLFAATFSTCVFTAGPSMMPGGTPEAYKYIEPIVTKVAAQASAQTLGTYVIVLYSALCCMLPCCCGVASPAAASGAK
jgi:hypothetical protein